MAKGYNKKVAGNNSFGKTFHFRQNGVIVYFCKTKKELIKKFFPLDKNYLLEEAQHRLENELLVTLTNCVVAIYESRINPLGLLDSFALKIKNYKPQDLKSLHNFYERISAIYRYKFGANQLEFLWDGSNHLDYYQKNWRQTFQDWTEKFCKQELFIQAVLDLTVFHPDDDEAQMIENRMNHFVLKYFDAKIDKVRGLMVA